MDDFSRRRWLITGIFLSTAFTDIAHFCHLVQKSNIKLVSGMFVEKYIALFELNTASILMDCDLKDVKLHYT